MNKIIVLQMLVICLPVYAIDNASRATESTSVLGMTIQQRHSNAARLLLTGIAVTTMGGITMMVSEKDSTQRKAAATVLFAGATLGAYGIRSIANDTHHINYSSVCILLGFATFITGRDAWRSFNQNDLPCENI